MLFATPFRAEALLTIPGGYLREKNSTCASSIFLLKVAGSPANGPASFAPFAKAARACLKASSPIRSF
ncbi:MAG: hypothetical protein QF415_12460, partial [Candidatus Undinarchaeales archaeon]|nr:hypothetical protein [Candidatus Undinarchaeales archaeon]